MSPEQIAHDQQRVLIAKQQEMAYRADLVNHAHVTTCASVFAVLLDKWFERHQRVQGGFPTPTANDLRWLAKMAVCYSAYVPEASKLSPRINDEATLRHLAGLKENDAFSFDHLLSVKDPAKTLTEPTGNQP